MIYERSAKPRTVGIPARRHCSMRGRFVDAQTKTMYRTPGVALLGRKSCSQSPPKNLNIQRTCIRRLRPAHSLPIVWTSPLAAVPPRIRSSGRTTPRRILCRDPTSNSVVTPIRSTAPMVADKVSSLQVVCTSVSLVQPTPLQ